MSLLPQGINAAIGNVAKNVSLEGVDGFNVTLVGATYNVSYSGIPPTGTVLQFKSFNLVNTYSTSRAFSTTYDSNARFASITITTLSDNSNLLITPMIAQTSTDTSMTVCSFINQSGLPVAGCSVRVRGNKNIYSLFSTFGKYQNTVLGQSITVDFCAFYTPGANNADNFVIGTNSSYSYQQTAYTQLLISEVQA